KRSGPGPGDGAADRDGIDRRIRGPVVTAHELDTGAGGDRAQRATSPAATAPAVPTPTAAVHTCAAITAASRQRRERQHPDYRCAYTHFDSSSARLLAGAGLFPVDEQEAARRVELRLPRSPPDQPVHLFDLVLGAIPALERKVAVASR